MDASVDVVAAAEAALGRRIERPRVEAPEGGYSWLTYLVHEGADRLAVVRVVPGGGTLDPYDPGAERTALVAARGAVPAPEVLLVERDPHRFGAPLQVQTVGRGERVTARSVSGRDRDPYRHAMAAALGSLHREGDPSALGDLRTSADALRWVIEQETAHYLRASPARHPGFEVGLRWLLTHLPDADHRPVVCHGDFRLNNTLWVGPGELGAVLDWERAWAGDPMCDIAFTRQFSGWAAVEGDAVSVYEAASGLRVRDEDMTFYLRLERWRSYTAAMRGLAAVGDGRRNEPMLAFIGEAGLAGMWDMADWIADDLVPLPGEIASADAGYHEPVGAARRAELAAALPADHPARTHLVDGDADDAALDRSLALLRTVTGLPELARVLSRPEPEAAWRAAYEVITRSAGDEGRRLHPALQALGYRFTGRPTFLPEMRWR